MFKTGIFGFLCTLSWFVTALVALNIGLVALNVFDFFSLNVFMMNPMLKMYIEYAIGFLGAWSLFGFVKHIFYCGGKCEC